MTYIEAAIIILKESGNLPMTAQEIWDKISQSDMKFAKLGKSPVSTLNALMARSSVNKSMSHSRKSGKFEILEDWRPAKFRLADFTKTDIKLDVVELDEILKDEKEVLENQLLYQITSKELDWKKLSIFIQNENICYQLEDCEEYTYIMQDAAHATIKIGKTKNNPELRLAQLKTGNPSISLLHVFPASQFPESLLHKEFNDYQKDLEWFFHTKGVRNFLDKEIGKHNSIIESYLLKKKLDDIESKWLKII